MFGGPTHTGVIIHDRHDIPPLLHMYVGFGADQIIETDAGFFGSRALITEFGLCCNLTRGEAKDFLGF